MQRQTRDQTITRFFRKKAGKNECISEAEAARMFGISPVSLRKIRLNNNLPETLIPERSGRFVLYNRQAAEALAKEFHEENGK